MLYVHPLSQRLTPFQRVFFCSAGTGRSWWQCLTRLCLVSTAAGQVLSSGLGRHPGGLCRGSALSPRALRRGLSSLVAASLLLRCGATAVASWSPSAGFTPYSGYTGTGACSAPAPSRRQLSHSFSRVPSSRSLLLHFQPPGVPVFPGTADGRPHHPVPRPVPGGRHVPAGQRRAGWHVLRPDRQRVPGPVCQRRRGALGQLARQRLQPLHSRHAAVLLDD